MKISIKTITALAAMSAVISVAGVYAKGGSPATGSGPYAVPALPTPSYTIAQAAALHGFDHVGILQSASVSTSNTRCPTETNPSRWGGTAKINGITITVPCNMIIQMPANTFKWADMVNGGASLVGYELHVVGNVVNGEHIAALMYISQQSLNGGSGVIQRIDYSTGRIILDTGAVLEINDPNGRFGRAQSPDPRFSVDDENPTIHSGTGYPMCIPRTLTDPNLSSTVDDPLCPKKNRPLSTTTTPCRLFGAAGVSPLPKSGELTQTPAGQFCRQYVMKSLTDPTRVATDPDPREQAPFEVGDHIDFSGTLINGIISAHTIEANVGIYTQPGTQPSYVSIGEFGVGTADPNAGTSVAGASQETQTKIFFEGETTDVRTPVDIYIVDVSPTGVKQFRWITPYDMTGECNPATTLAASCMGVSGGITTQFTEAQPQRFRIRARENKSTVVANMTNAPGRNFAVMARSLCKPSTSDLESTTGHSATLNACVASRPTVANGLVAGMYSAPVFEYIFPENTKQGDLIVPSDFWHLPFLVNGDGNVGPLTPKPW